MKQSITILITLTLSALAYGQADSAKDNDFSAKKSDSVTVYVQFIVLKNGTVADAKVVKTACNRCDTSMKKKFESEALRVIQQSPPIKNTTGKKLKHVQPVTFIVEEEE